MTKGPLMTAEDEFRRRALAGDGRFAIAYALLLLVESLPGVGFNLHSWVNPDDGMDQIAQALHAAGDNIANAISTGGAR